MNFHVFFRSPLNAEDEKVLGDICKATNSITKSTVETTAYLRALSKSRGLDITEFCRQVQDELKDQEGTDK